MKKLPSVIVVRRVEPDDMRLVNDEVVLTVFRFLSSVIFSSSLIILKMSASGAFLDELEKRKKL